MINNRWKRLKPGKHISPSPAFQSGTSSYDMQWVKFWSSLPDSQLFCHRYFPIFQTSYIADPQYFRYIHSLQCIDVTDEKPHPFKVLEKQYKVPGYLHLHHHHYNHSNCWKNNTRCLVIKVIVISFRDIFVNEHLPLKEWYESEVESGNWGEHHVLRKIS